MAVCASCTTVNDDGLKFCGECGARLPERCGSCGFANPPAFKFCGECGAALSNARPATAVTPPAAAVPAASSAGATPPVDIGHAGERRQITVLFCDLVGSTELADRLDPEEFRHVVREYQSVSADAIALAGGHIAQYLGDGLLVYFGYPQAREDDARRAVHASLGIVSAVAALSTRLQESHGVQLAVRCGIHTGAVVAGEMGARGATERLAVGSTPNVAARLQALAEPGTILLSGATRALVRGWFELAPLGAQTLRGMANAIDVFRALHESGEAGRTELDRARHLSPLVGREEELALVMRRLHLAREGEGPVVLVTGEAGVGKSRIVQVLTEQASAEGFARLVCRCESYYANSALHPIIGVLEGRLAFTTADDDAAKLGKIEALLAPLGLILEDSVPLLAALLSVPTGTRYAPLVLFPHKQKERTLELLVELLVRSAERQPLVFIIEDVHWADPSTHEFLALLVNRPPVPRLLSLMTTRPDFVAPWSARSHISTITLSRLSDHEVRAMIEAMADGRQLPEAVIAAVIARTDGVPVFVEELTAMVLEVDLQERAGKATLVDQLLSLAIPATLRDSLLARLDRMGDAKEIAQLAAVLGREFGYPLLRAVSGSTDAALAAHLARLVDAEVLYQRGTVPHATYRFKHALIQDAAYELLLKSTRRQFHQRAAETLASAFPAEAAAHPELLAHHFTEAGLLPQAIGSWLQAGISSLRRSANQEAIVQLRRGLACAAGLPESPMRSGMELGLCTALGPAYGITRGWAAPETAETYALAFRRGEELPDSPELFWAIRGIWLNAFVLGELDRALELGHRCLRLATAAGVAELLMEGNYTIGATHHFRGEQAAAHEHFERVKALDHPGRDLSAMFFTGLDALTSALSLNAAALWILGDEARARAESAAAVALGERVHHPNSLAFALYQDAWLHHAIGDRERVRELSQRVVTMSIDQGLAMMNPARMLLGWATDSADTIREATDAEHAQGMSVGLTYFLACLADVQLRAGQAGEADASIRRALSSAERTNSHSWDSELHRLRGDAAAAQGRVAAATAAYQQSFDIATAQGAAPFVARAAARLANTRTS